MLLIYNVLNSQKKTMAGLQKTAQDNIRNSVTTSNNISRTRNPKQNVLQEIVSNDSRSQRGVDVSDDKTGEMSHLNRNRLPKDNIPVSRKAAISKMSTESFLKKAVITRKGTTPASKKAVITRKGTTPVSKKAVISRKGTTPISKKVAISRKGTTPVSTKISLQRKTLISNRTTRKLSAKDKADCLRRRKICKMVCGDSDNKRNPYHSVQHWFKVNHNTA